MHFPPDNRMDACARLNLSILWKTFCVPKQYSGYNSNTVVITMSSHCNN